GELIVAICTEPIQRLEEGAPWAPKDLARVVHRGLERDLERRTPRMQAFIAALELFSGGTDRVGSGQLVGRTDEHREVLARRVGSLMIGRSTGDSQPGTVPGLAPPAPLHVVTRVSAQPESSSRGLWIGILVMLLVVAAGVAAVMLR